ncbi:DUF6879 family protein [Streptomyces sp. NPDC056910]|uniref:DUF6879 family protein n=1 Tax=Streptomyces sp. NPDC056910 TaxID=3345964 RepID=UPI00367AD05F
MPSLIPFEEITHLFTEFERTAFRLETRRGYATDRAGARFQAFLRGVDSVPEPDHPWKVTCGTRPSRGRGSHASGSSMSRPRTGNATSALPDVLL